MRAHIITGLCCCSLLAPMAQAATVSLADDTVFLETKLCATGRIIRIPVGGGKEDDTPDPTARACHALCSRDTDEDDGQPSEA